jgi:DNA-binding response OmpR family regulator
MQRTIFFGNADAQWRNVCERLFSASGFHVASGQDGLTCVAKLRTLMPDVIVVELEMPWGGGDGVVAWLREQSAPWTMPLVFVSGRASPETLSRRTGVPSTYCLQEPLAPTALLEAVCCALSPVCWQIQEDVDPRRLQSRQPATRSPRY